MYDSGQGASKNIPAFDSRNLDGISNIELDGNASNSTDWDISLLLSPTPVVVTNAKFDITYLNNAAEQVFGLDLKQKAVRKNRRNLIRYIGSNTSAFINWIQSDPERGLEVVLFATDLSRYIAFGKPHEIQNESFYVFNFLPSSRLTFLGMENAVCQAVFEYSRLSIYITDNDHRIISANPGFAEMFGYSRNELIGKRDTQLYDDESNENIYRDAFSVVMERDYWKGRVTAQNAIGEKFAAKLSVVAAPNSSNSQSESMYVHMLDDIEEQLEFESLLKTTAETDVLTDLPNRLGFNHHFERSLSEAVRTGNNLYVLFLDLDGFKPINDTHGHGFGDQLLVSVSNRIKHSIKAQDFVARLGGDEFVVIPGADIDDKGAHRMAEKIIASVSEVYSIRNIEVRCSTSIGIASYPEDGLSADKILDAADSAMYASKNGGGNRFTTYKDR